MDKRYFHFNNPHQPAKCVKNIPIDEKVASAVNEYLLENPPTGGLTIEQIKADIEIADAINKKHLIGSDNQDLSNLVVKVTGKGLSTNDYSASDQAKLSGLPNITVSAIPPAAPLIGDLWIDTN